MEGHLRALLALAAVGLTGAASAAAGPAVLAAPPGTTTTLAVAGDFSYAAIDGPRIALVAREGTPAITVRRLGGQGPVLGVRYRAAGNCKDIGCDEPPSVLLAGTQVALFSSGAGNT